MNYHNSPTLRLFSANDIASNQYISCECLQPISVLFLYATTYMYMASIKKNTDGETTTELCFTYPICIVSSLVGGPFLLNVACQHLTSEQQTFGFLNHLLVNRGSLDTHDHVTLFKCQAQGHVNSGSIEYQCDIIILQTLVHLIMR